MGWMGCYPNKNKKVGWRVARRGCQVSKQLPDTASCRLVVMVMVVAEVDLPE